MSRFYHDLSLNFNWWYVAIPLMVLCFLIIGTLRYHIDAETQKIRRRGSRYRFLVKGLAILSDVIITIMIISESSLGLLQLSMNCIGSEDALIYAFVVAAFILVMFELVFYYLLQIAVCIGGWTMLGCLSEDRRHKKAEEKKEEVQKIFRFITPVNNNSTIVEFPQNLDDAP